MPPIPKPIPPRDRLIFAMDVADPDAARRLHLGGVGYLSSAGISVLVTTHSIMFNPPFNGLAGHIIIRLHEPRVRTCR